MIDIQTTLSDREHCWSIVHNRYVVILTYIHIVIYDE